MATLQASPAQSRKGDSDTAVWAVVAIVVAIACAVAGWAYARQSTPSRADLTAYGALAAQDGAARGMNSGYKAGARAGRAHANAAAKLRQIQSRPSAQQAGYAAGIQAGRDRAAVKAGDQDSLGLMGVTEAYPATGYEDVLGTGLFSDEPGYSSSSFSSFGYGSSGSIPAYGDEVGYGTSGGDEPIFDF